MKHDMGGKLTAWQLVMLALGTSVGGSFFLGTALTLRTAGVGTIVAFIVGGILVYLILMALSELTVGRPTHGSFRAYAEVAFGPMASFVVGWVYWTGMIFAMASEATAVALFARLWLPAVPVWMLSLAVIVGVTALNLLDVRLFSTVESVMAAAKIVAIAAFIVLMGALVVGLIPGRGAIGLGAVRSEPFLPGGATGLAGSMLIVLFAYAGFEVLGLAAPDAKSPGRTVPRAVLITVAALILLYIGAMVVILPVLPIGAIGAEASPMVTALQHVGWPLLATGLNVIVMSASLSTMLAGMFGVSRMLYSLAEEGQAPGYFQRLTPTGAPRRALLASAAAMLVGVLLAYLLPRQVYLFLISSGAFSLLFAYLAILASQLVIRRREGCPSEGCQMPFFPYGTWIGIALVVLAIAAMPLVPGQGAGLVAGVALVLLYSIAFWLRRSRAGTPTSEPIDSDDPMLLR